MRNPEFTLDDLWALIETIEESSRRNQLFKLFCYLKETGSLQESPASCYLHGCFKGGWIDHSVRVAIVALKLQALLAPSLDRDSIVTCGLLHDISKLGFPKADGYIKRYILNPGFDLGRPPTKWNRPFNYNTNQPQFPLGVSSGIIASKFLDLTWSEIMAITASDGQYVEANRVYAHHETPLLMIISMADTWAGHVMEDDLDVSQFNTDADRFTVQGRTFENGDSITETQAQRS